VSIRMLSRLLAVLALVLSLGVVAASAEEPASPATRLFVRNDSTTCPGFPFLSQTAGTADSNCGYIHGAPLGEVYKTAGEQTNKKTYTTLPEEGTYALDASRDIAGQITIRNSRTDAAVPVRTGVGEVIVDLVLTGEAADGSLVALGTQSVKGTAMPNTDNVVLPFTFDLDPALGQPTLKGLSLQTDVHGLHLYSGYVGANDQSWFDVPIVPVPAATPTPVATP
jgi:hypothetical protein